MIVLRPDQFKFKNDIYASWQRGALNVLGVMPTGGGKSVVVSDIVVDYANLNARQCVIAHRRELVSQMSLHIANRGIPHNIIAPKEVVARIIAKHRRKFNGTSFINPSANCSVVAIDTLNARSDVLKDWASRIDFWTLDEGHHALVNNKWGAGIALFTRARGLGVTAVPRRADGAGLGAHADGVYHDMVVGPSTREMIDIGAICEFEFVLPKSDFKISDDAITDKGDFSPNKMRKASERSHIVGDVVQEYCKHAFGKRAICFATDVETATKIAQKFTDAFIPAACVSAKTPSAVREKYIEEFESGKLWVLINVDLFDEGFDVPVCEVVIMARPTASLNKYRQMCGRALRVAFGKLYGLIIDHVSNYKRHGFPDKPIVWTLDRREKRSKQEKDPEDIELIPCNNCSKPYSRVYARCPHCGNEPQITPSERSSIEFVDGDLILLDRNKLAEMRKATELASPADVSNRANFVAGPLAAKAAANRQIERIQSQQALSEVIAHWAGYQRSLGRDDSQSYRRFYLTAGIDVLSALALPRAEMDQIREKVQSWLP